MKVVKGIGIIIFGIPVCIAVGGFLEMEEVTFFMIGGLIFMMVAIIFEDDEKNKT